jgi:hypothetical protein
MKFNYYVWMQRVCHHPFSRMLWRFESTIHLARDKPDNTTHVSPKTSRVATVHDEDQRVDPGPPYPSAHLPCDTTLGAIRG